MRKPLARLNRSLSPANPSLTPEYVIAAVSTIVGLFLTQGLIDNQVAEIITGCAAVLIPLAFLVGQAAVKALHRHPAPTPAVVPPVVPGPTPVVPPVVPPTV